MHIALYGAVSPGLTLTITSSSVCDIIGIPRRLLELLGKSPSIDGGPHPDVFFYLTIKRISSARPGGRSSRLIGMRERVHQPFFDTVRRR